MQTSVSLAYIALGEPPAVEAENAAWIRLVDGIGFRYRWATEGLRAADETFQPGPESMTTRQLIEHIDNLVGVTCQAFSVVSAGKLPPNSKLEDIRLHTLRQLQDLSSKLAAITEADMTNRTIRGVSIMYAINGPLSDALTHIGQINAWRRLNGNPGSKVNVFLGKPESPEPSKT